MNNPLILRRTTTQAREIGKVKLPPMYEFIDQDDVTLARIGIREGDISELSPYIVQEYVPNAEDMQYVLGYEGSKLAVYRNASSLADAMFLARKRARAIGERLAEIKGLDLIDNSDQEAVLVPS